MLIAVVGMPGSGKTEATAYLETQGFTRIRFGDITDEEVARRGLELNEANERNAREELRKEHGMAAYAKLNAPKIDKALKKGNVVLDGLYSWEEYLWLKKKYPNMIVVAIYASPATRYARLGRRKIRTLKHEECAARDAAQLESLHTGGPIAMADYTIINEGTLDKLGAELKRLLKQL